MKNEIIENKDKITEIYKDIKSLINKSKINIYEAVNKEMLELYWQIGKIIMEIQEGERRAKYGKNVLINLSNKLTSEFGSGFSLRNLRNMRLFYIMNPIRQSVTAELTWTHYVQLISIKEEEKRNFYMKECINSRWSVRELQRQIKSKLYDRLIIMKDEERKEEIKEKGLIIKDGRELLKDPYVLEFLGIKEEINEKELERKILEHIKEFIQELGRGYSLVGRQERISMGRRKYHPDLVFYNSITRNYLIIELKIGKYRHQDIGQIKMYVKYYDEKIKREEENQTIGIILCADKEEIIVKYTLGEENNIYVSKYLLDLPSESDLIKIIENDLY